MQLLEHKTSLVFFFFFFFLQLYIEHLVIWEQKNLDKECGVNSID
jgi:hypothetical protein